MLKPEGDVGGGGRSTIRSDFCVDVKNEKSNPELKGERERGKTD